MSEAKILADIEALSDEARARVLKYLNDRYETASQHPAVIPAPAHISQREPWWFSPHQPYWLQTTTTGGCP